MTFEEALNKKNTMDNKTFYDEGFKIHVFVTPEDPADFKTYLENIKKPLKYLKDEKAKFFSKNNNFLLRGLCMRGTIILHKEL